MRQDQEAVEEALMWFDRFYLVYPSGSEIDPRELNHRKYGKIIAAAYASQGRELEDAERDLAHAKADLAYAKMEKQACEAAMLGEREAQGNHPGRGIA